MRFDHILIVTYGRSGSTLLQGVLNSIDGVVIRGENCNLFYHLFQATQAMERSKTHDGSEPSHSFWGNDLLEQDVFLRHAQTMARDLLLGEGAEPSEVACFGFKEIRYLDITDDLEAYLEFLNRVFPNAALVFNKRNVDDVVRSGWWKDRDELWLRDAIARTEQLFDAYCRTHGNGFTIYYEDVIGQTPRLEALFEFLGAPYVPATIERVLGIPHSAEPRQSHVKRMFYRQTVKRAIKRLRKGD